MLPQPLSSPASSSRNSLHSYRSSSDSDLPTANSRTALILIPDDNGRGLPEFEENEVEDDHPNPISPYDEPFELRTSVVLPPLTSSDVTAYLIAPSLRLGAMSMYLKSSSLPLGIYLPALLVVGTISVFCRHLWQLMAKHLRTPDPEDILLDALARGRGKDGQRRIFRHILRFCNGLYRIFISALYLRTASEILEAVVEAQILQIPSTIFIPILLTCVILPLCLSPNLASKRMLYSTNISILTFIVWLGCILYSRPSRDLWINRGLLWDGISSMLFAFTSTSALPLFTSLKLAAHPHHNRPSTVNKDVFKSPRIRSFTLISIISAVITILAISPLLFLGGKPDLTRTARFITTRTESGSASFLIAASSSTALILGIPFLLVPGPSITILRPPRSALVSKLLYVLLTLGLSLLCQLFTRIYSVLSDVALIMAVASSFMIPALVHIVTHHVRRPLSIVFESEPGASNTPLTVRSSHTIDDLLLRKERMMQRKRLGRRLIFDFAAWLLVFSLTAGAGLSIAHAMHAI